MYMYRHVPTCINILKSQLSSATYSIDKAYVPFSVTYTTNLNYMHVQYMYTHVLHSEITLLRLAPNDILHWTKINSMGENWVYMYTYTYILPPTVSQQLVYMT